MIFLTDPGLELPDPLKLVAPLFMVCILAEQLAGRHFGNARYCYRDTLSSISVGVGYLLIGIARKALEIFVYLLVWRNFSLRLFDVLPVMAVFLAAFLVDDFLYYAIHRLSHRVRWFWAAHVTHHSSQYFNFSTALRLPWTGLLTPSGAFRIPFIVLGFDPYFILFWSGVSAIYQFFLHTETVRKLSPPIEAVFNTPSHHRVHHSSALQHLDCNYGGILIVWDRLFGTFVPELAPTSYRYGLRENIGSFNPLVVVAHEWIGMLQDMRRASGWNAKMGVLLRPPGWSWEPQLDRTTESMRRS